MTTAYLCVLIAGLLPYLGTIISKSKGFDLEKNKRVREFQSTLTGYQQRANWAQQNGFEAFPFFAAGVIIAHLKGADQALLDAVAIGFVVARLAYLGAFLANQATLRSLIWSVGIGLAVYTYFL